MIIDPTLPPSQRQIRALLERALDPALLALLHQAAQLADQRAVPVALVGGVVRDMLLGRPPGDLDLLVEGDAIALAEALAKDLGGSLRSHPPFGTATLLVADAAIDLVMARRERYERPAALPTVSPGSLRDDLLRRDVTINSLAIGLNASRYGQLYDYCGGLDDLRQGLMRVLHDQSFRDDPTRILRVARLAARLGFVVEPHTRDLIGAALAEGMFERTTPVRLLRELQLVLHEPRPEDALALLDSLGALRALHPALGWSAALAARFAAARQAAFADISAEDLGMGLLGEPLAAPDREQLIVRLGLPAAQARLLRELPLARRLLDLPDHAPPSAIDQTLSKLGAPALRVAQLSLAPPAPAMIERYLTELRPLRTELDGRYLRELGLTPGPRFTELLAGLRAARLDGLVSGRDAEAAWLRQAIAAGA